MFSWLKALTDGIDLAAPECVSAKWSYKLYVELLFAGLGALFAAALLMHEVSRLLQRLIKFRDPESEAEANAKRLSRLNSLWRRCNDPKQFAALAVQFFYIYIAGLLLQAWDCIDTPDDCIDTGLHRHARIRGGPPSRVGAEARRPFWRLNPPCGGRPALFARARMLHQ